MNRFGKVSSNLDLSVSCENLNSLDARQSTLFSSRKALILELAYSICRGGEASAEEIRSNYFSAFTASESMGEFFESISVTERVEVCIEIASLMGKENPFSRFVLGQGEACPMSAREKIAYVKNNFTDSAYLSFSKLLHAPRFSYSDSFETICEEVFNGDCEFCILPTETSAEGRLFSFYSLIDKYELKTSAVCSVERDGGASFTRFALLKRAFSDEASDKGRFGRPEMLELRISQPSSADSIITNIFKAADACSMPLFRVDSLPLPYGDSLLSHYAVFGANHETLHGFLMYIALEFPQCYVSGLYSKRSAE